MIIFGKELPEIPIDWANPSTHDYHILEVVPYYIAIQLPKIFMDLSI